MDYVPDATPTWDMTQPDRSVLRVHAIKRRTATVLAGRFTQICTVEEALERAAPRRRPKHRDRTPHPSTDPRAFALLHWLRGLRLKTGQLELITLCADAVLGTGR